ncbi:MAG: 3-dehydroquinate synthase [Clostridia bacterium]|nr:3-dehydroquinate synthase [Clostridia bacterium]
MPVIPVNIPGKTTAYSVFIESGLLSRSSHYFTSYTGHKAAVISDTNVAPLYADILLSELRSAGVEPFLITLPAGETTKCSANLDRLYDFLLDHRITRSDIVIALGGGVIGDLTGYAAATYLRGTRFIQVPTTLLAQVDSSVGGKVAINHPKGKNLLGAFYQPELVIIDTDTLGTLDSRQVGAGLGEVIKYGCILDAPLFERIERCGCRENLVPLYPEIIARCIELKAQVVSEDPLDTGLRMILNFGHTLAHAIENAAGYGTVLHGEAVCIGMVAAAGWGETLGVTPSGTADRIRRLLTALDLPVSLPESLTPDCLFPSMALDKKSLGKDIRVILLDDIGQCHSTRLGAQKLFELMEDNA